VKASGESDDTAYACCKIAWWKSPDGQRILAWRKTPEGQRVLAQAEIDKQARIAQANEAIRQYDAKQAAENRIRKLGRMPRGEE
jgi:hypothetical protein